eukprot:TRINITY_DN114365_c0_g1_i1.p1 TRINITY_DN114365_c0_g1~~TRINITY_DN114365_c0_g1_i1.p1  ORF type:complete len:107 (+),score=6.92 TRINITY_DN114365_c0_g1_i1:72-392(+)
MEVLIKLFKKLCKGFRGLFCKHLTREGFRQAPGAKRVSKCLLAQPRPVYKCLVTPGTCDNTFTPGVYQTLFIPGAERNHVRLLAALTLPSSHRVELSQAATVNFFQ